LAIGEGVVDYRSKEIDGIQQREVIAQAKHSSIVAGGCADEQIGAAAKIQPRENRIKVRRTQLAGSTRGFASRGKTNQVVARGIIVVARRH
jgi:hypothetical protein